MSTPWDDDWIPSTVWETDTGSQKHSPPLGEGNPPLHGARGQSGPERRVDGDRPDRHRISRRDGIVGPGGGVGSERTHVTHCGTTLSHTEQTVKPVK